MGIKAEEGNLSPVAIAPGLDYFNSMVTGLLVSVLTSQRFVLQ